jgi:hypothetical protein
LGTGKKRIARGMGEKDPAHEVQFSLAEADIILCLYIFVLRVSIIFKGMGHELCFF